MCKIADFGESCFFKAPGDDNFKDSVGTYQFFSPEMCDTMVTNYSGRAADIWALGATLYAMTYGKLPYDSEDNNALFQMILN